MNEPASSILSGRQATLEGWGRTHQSECFAIQASDDELLCRAMGADARGALPGPVIPRGGGNSYGDAGTSRGGTVIDMRHRRRLLSFDLRTGVLVAEAGFTLGQAVDLGLAHGWLPPVLPGSRHVTLGGAVAADVHGKNHPQVGSFGRHVAWLAVVNSSVDEARLLSPSEHPDEFWATVGGFGLTGAITVVALRLRPVDETAQVRRGRGRDLSEVMDLMEAEHVAADELTDVHSVAWLDSTAPAHRIGRGVVQTTRVGLRGFDTCDGASTAPPGHGISDPTGGGAGHLIPPDWPPAPRHDTSWPRVRLIGRAAITTANHVHWLSSGLLSPGLPSPGPRSERTTRLPDCLFPLRHAEHWPALFGPRGLVQYQFAVPDHRPEVLSEALDLLRRRRMPPALTSLKRLGPRDPAPLTFARPGWTLAMDLPASWPRLAEALRDLDELVADAGGRVYLAKDSRLSALALTRMYPELESWQRIRDEMDPAAVLGSDLSARVGLTATGVTSKGRVPS
jgi:decaprenylphospho-beta-D-ribofuranose 2-oxidase